MKSSTARHRTIYLLLATVTIFLGVTLRRVPVGLPVFVVIYGGSLLWAAMVYWLFATLRPAWRPAETAFVSALFAALVEFFKLYHAPLIDSSAAPSPERCSLAATFLSGTSRPIARPSESLHGSMAASFAAVELQLSFS